MRDEHCCRNMKTFILVIVDQLGWRDRNRLPLLCKALGQPRQIVNNYLPTVTETAHATISTGTLPEQHGIIGEESLFQAQGGGIGSRRVDERVFRSGGYGAGTPLVLALCQGGIECLVVAGKPKVAHLLAPTGPLAPAGLTKLWLQPDRRGRLNWERTSTTRPLLPACELRSLATPCADSLLIQAADGLLDDHFAVGGDRGVVLVLALPCVDILGHCNHRDSPLMDNAFGRLDDELTDFIKRRLEAGDAYTVVGDHGWRDVDTAVWLGNGKVWVCQRDEEPRSVELPDGILHVGEVDEAKPAIVCDGGTMRVWVREGDQESVATWFMENLPEGFDSVESGQELSTILKERERVHENWGHIVCFVKKNVAVCKREWVKKAEGIRVPVVEHGTNFAEDATVPMWSHVDRDVAAT